MQAEIARATILASNMLEAGTKEERAAIRSEMWKMYYAANKLRFCPAGTKLDNPENEAYFKVLCQLFADHLVSCEGEEE